MKNILIVEDSKLISGVVSKKISTDFPFNCIIKESYQEAVSLFEETNEEFFLAVLDLNLPGAPNGEIVNYVASKNIPIIVMTSRVNDTIRDKILSLQPIDYLIKGPQFVEILANVISRYIRNLNFHILLVDDSEFSRQQTKKLLDSQYFHVSEASDGVDALICLEENPSIKMILTDYHMPKMNGLQLITKVREKHSMEDIAIIGISARGNPLLASKLLKCGANDFLSKPYFAEELIWRINQNVEILTSIAKNRSYQVQLEHEVQEQTAKIINSQAMVIQQEKLAAIGQLAAGVAHEINNPIGFISSNLNTLKKYVVKLMEYIDTPVSIMSSEELLQLRKKLKIDYISEDIKELVQESTEGVERVKEIINNLKIFSRKDEAIVKESDINECIESTIKVIWNELKYKATVVKEYDELPLLKCYPQQLSQVFMNLMINAVHAIDKEGEIKIKTEQNGNNILISISDTGHGIPAENMSKLFEHFFTTKEIGKGTGLGLSIAHEIIQTHDGEIRVSSEVGKGSTFTIELPVAGIA